MFTPVLRQSWKPHKTKTSQQRKYISFCQIKFVCSLFYFYSSIMLGSSRNKHTLLKVLLECRRVLDLWGTVPYNWDSKRQSFRTKGLRASGFLRWKWNMIILYTVTTGLQIHLIKDILTIPLFIQCMFYLIFDCIGVFTIRDQWRYAKDTVALLNGMISFEKINQHQISPPHLGMQRTLCLLIARLLAYCATLLTVTGQVSFIKQPCIPIQPGFFFVDRCKRVGAPNLIPQGSALKDISLFLPDPIIIWALALFAFFSRTCMLNSIMAQMSLGIILYALCLLSYVKALLVCDAEKGLKLFQQVQLLVKNYNHVSRRGTVSSLLYVIIMGTISMYACVILGKFFSVEKRLIYSYTALCMFFFGLQMYGLLGTINEKSKELLEKYRKDSDKGSVCVVVANRKRTIAYRKKLLGSFQPLKIYLGDVNFVDICTPLLLQDFIIQRTVDLSLLT